MLIEFSVTNFKSLKAETVLSFTAAALTELSDNVRHLPVAGRKQGVDVLTVAGCYGANASGKSTILEAMECSASFIRHSATKYNDGDELPFVPFLLDPETADSPCTFQYTFLLDDMLYVYGFSADSSRVHDEWLNFWPKGREKVFFSRSKNILGSDFKRGSDVLRASRSNALALSTGALLNEDICKKISRFFASIITIDCNLSDRPNKINEKIHKENIPVLLPLLKFADIGIKEISMKPMKDVYDAKENSLELFLSKIKTIQAEPPTNDSVFEFGKQIQSLVMNAKDESITHSFVESVSTLINSTMNSDTLFFLHAPYSSDMDKNNVPYFTFLQESDGTLKYLLLLDAALEAFKHGGVLIIDELDARLHPLLAAGFLKFFQSSGNTRAQLVFSTHASELLDADVLRRDQIYLTEKDESGATTLTSLAEYSVRKDSVLGKRYLEGRYGGIPYLHEGYFQLADEKLRKLLAHSTPEGGA